MSQAIEMEVESPHSERPGKSSPATEQTPEPAALQERGKPEPRNFHFARWIFLLVVIVAAGGAVLWWENSKNFETTDDAQIEGHLALVSSRISGTVTYINPRVANNQPVQTGELLLELDPRDYDAELEHARANLVAKAADAHSAQVTIPIVDAGAFGRLRSAEAGRAQAAASVKSEQAGLSVAQHRLLQDDAVYARAERDRIRYLALVEKREISRSDYDGRETEAISAAQAVEADRAAISAGEQKISQAENLVLQRDAEIQSAQTAPQQVADAHARSESTVGSVRLARADLHTAELNLSYTKIYAPLGGVIGRKTVELGHRIQPGQSLMAIIPLDDIWITANFKETQLKRMHPGQPVTVRVDTFGRDYKGTVESLPGGAGPLFSLFPPENATGNYVKVVQRFPVRIRLDADQNSEHLLRPGMSVEPAVSVR